MRKKYTKMFLQIGWDIIKFPLGCNNADSLCISLCMLCSGSKSYSDSNPVSSLFSLPLVKVYCLVLFPDCCQCPCLISYLSADCQGLLSCLSSCFPTVLRVSLTSCLPAAFKVSVWYLVSVLLSRSLSGLLSPYCCQGR